MRFRDYDVSETIASVARALEPFASLRDAHDANKDEAAESESRGLICMFCGEDGFEDQESLEEHIESHPYTKRRS